MPDRSKPPGSSPEASRPAGDGIPRGGRYLGDSSPVLKAVGPLAVATAAGQLPRGVAALLAAAPSKASAAALGLSIKRVEQVRRGDRPRLSPAALRRWEAHLLQHHPLTGRWVLRRVRGGEVQFKGLQYRVPPLLAVDGQQLGVAPSRAGALLMQVLATSCACFVAHPLS